jgi:hypothetical protein
MGGSLWVLARLAPAPDARGLANAGLVIILIAGAVAIYALLLTLLGVIRWDEALIALRQNAQSDLRDQGSRGM